VDPDGPEDTDLPAALGDRHQHDVEDGDAGDDQRDAGDREQKPVQQREELGDPGEHARQREHGDPLLAAVQPLADAGSDRAGVVGGVGLHDHLRVVVVDELPRREHDRRSRPDRGEGSLGVDDGEDAVAVRLDLDGRADPSAQLRGEVVPDDGPLPERVGDPLDAEQRAGPGRPVELAERLAVGTGDARAAGLQRDDRPAAGSGLPYRLDLPLIEVLSAVTGRDDDLIPQPAEFG